MGFAIFRLCPPTTPQVVAKKTKNYQKKLYLCVFEISFMTERKELIICKLNTKKTNIDKVINLKQ